MVETVTSTAATRYLEYIEHANRIAQLQAVHHVSEKILGLAVYRVAKALAPNAPITEGDQFVWLRVFANLDLDAQVEYILSAKVHTARWDD